MKEGGHAFGHDPATVSRLVSTVRRATSLPILPKLAPNVPDVTVFVRAAQEAGADAVAMINTLPAMVIDIDRQKPVLANRTGGLSGRGIHPVAVKLVWDAAAVATVPILAMGGIFEPEDAIEFLLAGAKAVAIGTATFIDPSTPIRVIDGIEAYMVRHGYTSMADFKRVE